MRKCLDSILAQTFYDYECLLVDDGSQDESPAICDEYATMDARFKVFHKANGGLSDARNFGLAHAQGEYTIFFDPDDWVDEDCLKDLYAKAQETDADMVMCDLYYNDPYRQRYSKQEPTSLDHNDVLKDLIMGKVYGFTVTKLIRRTLYDQCNLLYPVGMYGCEDQYTICKLLKNNIRIAYLPKAYYHYMHYGNNSQSRKYNMEVYKMDLKMRNRFCELLKDTEYGQLTFDRKSSYILHRAFLYGFHTFDSKSFRTTFADYKYLVKNEKPFYMRCFFTVSLHGNYRLARKVFGYLFSFKQLLKRIC